MNELLNTIRTEIMRLKLNVYDEANQFDIGARSSLTYLDSFLDTLPEQPAPTITKSNALFDKCVENCDPAVMKEVSDNVDKMLASEELEEEIKRYRKEEMPVVLESDLNDIARHFYKLGKNSK